MKKLKKDRVLDEADGATVSFDMWQIPFAESKTKSRVETKLTGLLCR